MGGGDGEHRPAVRCVLGQFRFAQDGGPWVSHRGDWRWAALVTGPGFPRPRDGGHHLYFDEEVWPDQPGDHPQHEGRLVGDEFAADFDVGPGVLGAGEPLPHADDVGQARAGLVEVV